MRRRYHVVADRGLGGTTVVARCWTAAGADRRCHRATVAEVRFPAGFSGSVWATQFYVVHHPRRRRVWDGRINDAGIPAGGSVQTVGQQQGHQR